MMKRNFASYVRTLFAMSVIVVFGCSSKHNDLVGTWDIQGGPTAASITFQSDGNYKTEARSPGRTSMQSSQYKLNGDKLEFSPMQRSATVRWVSPDELVMTGDDGVAKTLKRRK